MLYIILLLIIIFFIIYLVFFKNNNEAKEIKETEKRFKIEKEKKEKAILSDPKTEKFIDKIEEKHYGSGFMIPLPAYKANTSREDSFVFDIHKNIKNSKTNNIYQLYQELTNDNYSLFNNLNKLQPNDASSRMLYQNLHYNPKTERKYLFKTGLPKVKDLIEVDVYNPIDKDYISELEKNKKNKINEENKKIKQKKDKKID
jgi:hypothetical protein